MSEGTVDQVLAGEATWCLVHGDCRDVLPTLPECVVDAVVCDPPYHLTSASRNGSPRKNDPEKPFGRHGIGSAGFMGKTWDGGDVALNPETWAAVLRACKPGAHLAAFGGTRTYHRIACAIEDGGFEIRDSILSFGCAWVYGSGFPKSLDLAKAADKAAGIWRGRAGDVDSGNAAMGGPNYERTEKGEPITAAAAAALQGLGTALKPSFEPITLARKPIDGTVLANVQEFGTGGLDIDACRVAHAGAADLAAHQEQVEAIKNRGGSMGNSWKNSSDLSGANDVTMAGRWPPNCVFTHSQLCKKTGTAAVPANPTWDTPNRATEPSAFTGSEVSRVRHANGRDGEPSADKRYADKGATSFAPLPGSRRDETESVDVFDCAPGCPVAELARQSGSTTSNGGLSPGGLANVDGMLRRKGETLGANAGGLGDTGSAARYFPQFEWTELDEILRYEPKACRAERDAGLDQFRVLTGAQATDSEEGQVRLESPRSGAGRHGGIRNNQPTIKPIELIRWLVRLTKARLPQGQKPLVLVPFGGAGSEMIACVLEGCRVIGIELNNSDAEPYVEIARARLHHIEGRQFVPRASLRSTEPPKQTTLFEVGS